MQAPAYQPRQPRQTALWQTVQSHWRGFEGRVGPSGGERRIPRFVDVGMRRFLSCGSLASGFARLRCNGCHDEMLVAFSCKVRGLCPSCDGRRITEQAMLGREVVVDCWSTRWQAGLDLVVG